MSPPHLANLAVHIGAGTVAMSIGLFLLLRTKGTAQHRRWGRIFCYFTLVVSASAALGTLCFRFIPLFAVLTVLVPYQLASGWRSACTQALGPSAIDAGLTCIAILLSGPLVPIVFASPAGRGVVAVSSLGALAMILGYDSLRWLFPRRWFCVLWKYDHFYKLVSSLFAMLSALIGNVVRVGQPWSQLAPSAAGVLVILYFFVRLRGERPGMRRAS
jgi:uncharacterized membrane protein